MTSWHSKEVGDGVAALAPTQKLHEAFFNMAKTGSLAPGFGVFARYDFEANMVTWYFSPESELLALAFGATPCEKPVPQEGLALSVGDQRSWQIHFPGYSPSRRRG